MAPTAAVACWLWRWCTHVCPCSLWLGTFGAQAWVRELDLVLSRSRHTAAQHVLLGWVQTAWQPVAPWPVCLPAADGIYVCVCVLLKLGLHCQGGGGFRLLGNASRRRSFVGLWWGAVVSHLTCVSLRGFCEALLRQLVGGSMPCRHPHLTAPYSCR